MANNYVQGTISPCLPLTEAQVGALGWMRDELPLEGEEGYEDLTDGEKLSQQWAEKYKLEWGTGISVEVDCMSPRRLYYLYAENGLEEGAPEVLQEILQGLPEEYTHISYEAAAYCSKLRPGEFGGHACFITRDNIERMSTNMWLHKRSVATELQKMGEEKE